MLNGIDLAIDGAETLAVLGRSGTGKSVLLKLLIGLETARLRVPFESMARRSPRLEPRRLNEIRKNIGFLFQQAALYDSLTVATERRVPAPATPSFQPNRSASVYGVTVESRHGADPRKLPAEIRVECRSASAWRERWRWIPRFMFDEPTAGLDPITAEKSTVDCRFEKERKMTSVVVTHDIHGVRFYSDRVVMLREGSVVMDGTFGDFEKSKDEFLARFLKTAA